MGCVRRAVYRDQLVPVVEPSYQGLFQGSARGGAVVVSCSPLVACLPTDPFAQRSSLRQLVITERCCAASATKRCAATSPRDGY